MTPAFPLSDRVVSARGFLDYVVWRRGQIIECVREENLVVDTSKLMLSRLLGGDVTNRSVTQIGVGTNGTAPVGGNTALTSQFAKAIDGHSYPTSSSINFAFSLGAGDANGMAILEFGLLAADGTLFSRKTRASALNKASDITVSGTWLIQF